jgi:hypothetical protein
MHLSPNDKLASQFLTEKTEMTKKKHTK